MAPMKSVGANIPPGVPLEKENVVAISFRKTRASKTCQTNCPCKA